MASQKQNSIKGAQLKCAKPIAVAQKRPGRSKKTWAEVLVNDRKKL